MATERAQAVAEVQRRIGRNILLYQATEQILKMLLPLMRHENALHCLDGFENRHAEYSRKTLGQLFRAFRDRSQTDQPLLLEMLLSDLLAKRNDLVHHAGFDLTTVESCRKAAAKLNEEHEQASQMKNLSHEILLEVLQALCDITFRGTPEETEFRKLYEQAKAAQT
jgi:hypothetical protein